MDPINNNSHLTLVPNQNNTTDKDNEKILRVYVDRNIIENKFFGGTPIKFSNCIINSVTNLTLDEMHFNWQRINFENNHDKIADDKEIFIYVKSKKKVKQVDVRLPNKVKENLIQFLLKGKPVVNFNCLSFVTYATNQFKIDATNQFKIDAPTHIDFDEWYPIVFDEKKLIPGSVIVLYEKDAEFSFFKPIHFALYLGKKIYLSLLGEGPLVMNTN